MSYLTRIPRRLRSTLFPYTTLFRSVPILKANDLGDRAIVFSNTYLEQPEIQRYTGRDHRLFEFYMRSEEHTSELQSRGHLVCRLLREKKEKETILLGNKC